MVQGFWDGLDPKKVSKIEVAFPVRSLVVARARGASCQLLLSQRCHRVPVCRCAVPQNMGLSKLSVNAMLGREAHLACLESQQFAAQLVLGFPQFFDL
jgi:hypothetical protein